MQVRNISPPPGFKPWTVQPVASRYTVNRVGRNFILVFTYMVTVYLTALSVVQIGQNAAGCDHGLIGDFVLAFI